MNTSKQVNFDPGLFGDPAPVLLAPRPAVRRWPAMLAGSIVGAVLASATILIPAQALHHRNSSALPVPADERPTAAIRAASIPAGEPLPTPQYSDSWCESGDAFCTRVLTGNPVVALKKNNAQRPSSISQAVSR